MTQTGGHPAWPDQMGNVDILQASQGTSQTLPKKGYAQAPASAMQAIILPPMTVTAADEAPVTPEPGYLFDCGFFTGLPQFLSDLSNPASPASQAFMRLRQSQQLMPQHRNHSNRIIGVSGNSLIAAGLSASLAQAGEKVIVLEMGQEDPLLGALFNLNTPCGLSELEIGRASCRERVFRAV